ncbi:MAG: DUF6600 domain-containing protein [Polyangiaceae bacterium]
MPAVRHPIGATTAPAPAQATERSNEASEASEEEAAAPDDQAESDQPVGGDPEDTDPSSLTEFHSTLDPYGTWTEDPTYGTVWTPSRDAVGSDFTPYVSGGHWLYDDDDYLWASDYPWGWAPFHYGRWVYGPSLGWGWIPGRTYAGAWVSWRYGVGGSGYVGWAPLAPTWCWRGGVAVGVGFVPVAPYAFVPTAHLFAPVLGAHLVTGPQVRSVAMSTRPWTAPTTAGGGRVLAHPTVGGPPPSVLHISTRQMAGAALHDPGIARARAFAQSRGSGAPLGGTTGARTARSMTSRSGRPASRPADVGASHFGGRLGAGFVGSPPLAPAYGGTPRPYFGDRASVGSMGAAARGGTSMEGSHVAPSGGGFGSPAGHGAVSPPVRSTPSFQGGGGGGFHGGGGGGYHGGGGGFHGGGGGGGHGGGRR